MRKVTIITVCLITLFYSFLDTDIFFVTLRCLIVPILLKQELLIQIAF